MEDMVSNRANILNKKITNPLLLHHVDELVGSAYKSNLPVLGEGRYVCRPRPKVGDPAFTLPRPLWEREKPCEQSELRIRVRGNLRTLSAIGINQLDSRAAHENDNLIVSWAYLPNKLTPHPACSHLLLLGEGLKKGRCKK